MSSQEMEALSVDRKFDDRTEQRPEVLGSRPGPKLAQPRASPIPDLIRQLDSLSALLRHYVAGFLKFRPALEECDQIHKLMTASASGFQHWDEVSQRLQRVRPSTFEPPMLDGAWADEIAPNLETFRSAYDDILVKVDTFQYTQDPEETELADSRRLVGTMRRAMRAALDSCMSRADELADDVRSCAEKITMLIGLGKAELEDRKPTPPEDRFLELPAPIENPSSALVEGAVAGGEMESKPRPEPSPTSRGGGSV